MSAAKPMLKYCLQDQVVAVRAVQRALKSGNFFSAATAALIRNASIVTLTPAFSFSLLRRDAERFEIGDVGLVELRDVRNHHPVAREVGAGDLLDPRQRLRFDGAELGEIDLRPRQQVERAAAAELAGAAAAVAAPLSACLTNACTSSCRMRPFGPVPVTRARVDAQFARELAHRRRRVRRRERFAVDGRRPWHAPDPRARAAHEAERSALAALAAGPQGQALAQAVRRRGRSSPLAGEAPRVRGAVAAAVLEREHQRAFADLVADLDPHFLTTPAGRRRARPSSPCRIRA